MTDVFRRQQDCGHRQVRSLYAAGGKAAGCGGNDGPTVWWQRIQEVACSGDFDNALGVLQLGALDPFDLACPLMRVEVRQEVVHGVCGSATLQIVGNA